MFRRCLLLLLTGMAASCDGQDRRPQPAPTVAVEPLPAVVRPQVAFSAAAKKRALESLPSPMFREVTAKLGLDFQHRASTELRPKRASLVMPLGLEGGGVAAGDFDGDGSADLYFAGDGGGKLYRNLGGRQLEDVSAARGLASEGESRAGYFIDYDADGDLDLFVTFVYRTNRLYQNEVPAVFRDVTEAVRLTSGNDVTHEALWFDYDLDGLLDLYTANFGAWPEGTSPLPREPNRNGGPNRLYHHRTGGASRSFEEVGKSLGVDDPGWTHCVGAWDVDEDGFPDVFSLNDFGPSYLLLNLQGQRFIGATEKLGVDHTFNAMNFTLLDLEHDGHFAAYITQIMRRPKRQGDDLRRLVTNKLFCRRPDGRYENQHDRFFEPADLGWAWYAGGIDYENDGDVDFIVLNGTEAEVPAAADPASDLHQEGRMFVARHARQRNVFFACEDGYFYDASERCPLAYAGHSRGAAVFDLDGDGDLDVALNDYEGPARLFENVQSAAHSWVRFRLEGTRSNRSAIGARIEVHFGGLVRHAQVSSTSGYLSQNPLDLHFGLGRAQKVERVVIRWPSGKVEERRDLPANRIHEIRESL